jgi:hypothetical protein
MGAVREREWLVQRFLSGPVFVCPQTPGTLAVRRADLTRDWIAPQ